MGGRGMRLLAYQGISPVSRVIRWQTRGDHSHIALEHDGAVIEALANHPGPWWRKGGQVCWGKDFRVHHTPGTVVDVFEIPGVDADRAWEFAARQIGMPYEYDGVVSFATRQPAAENGAWFCSEVSCDALSDGGVQLLRIPSYLSSPRDVVASPLIKHVGTWVC